MSDSSTEDRPLPANCWRRGEEPEFARVANFTDGVYAIALTLLVLQITVPPLRDPGDVGEMVTALGDQTPKFVAFGVAFLLLSRYWMAHHAFFGRLRAVNDRLIATNLIYLAFVALLPFPAYLVGEYEENPVSVIVFAANMAMVSGLEVVMFVRAHRLGLMRVTLAPDAYRWGVRASLAPVAMFVVTMPLALVSTTWTLISWAIIGTAAGWWFDRRAPASVAESDGGMVHTRRRQRLRRLGRASSASDDTPPADR